MSEAVELWLFGTLFTANGLLFFWVVSLKMKMMQFTATAAEIKADVSECIKGIRDHEEHEDRELRAMRMEIKQVNANILNLAVKVGENSR